MQGVLLEARKRLISEVSDQLLEVGPACVIPAPVMPRELHQQREEVISVDWESNTLLGRLKLESLKIFSRGTIYELESPIGHVPNEFSHILNEFIC